MLQRPSDSALLGHLYVLLVHRLRDNRNRGLDHFVFHRKRERSVRREADSPVGPENGGPVSGQEAPLRGENPNSGQQNPERHLYQSSGAAAATGQADRDLYLESFLRPRGGRNERGLQDEVVMVVVAGERLRTLMIFGACC